MITLTSAQLMRYNALFESSKAIWSPAKHFEKILIPIFGDRIFGYFLHSHTETQDLSYYFKNLILVTKFLTYLALEKEDDAVFYSFYHKIAAACVEFLKRIFPEQAKDKGSVYTPQFEALLHDIFFNSLCIKPGETDRVKALFSTKCAIAASTHVITIYRKSIKEHGLHFAKNPSFLRLSTHTSKEITPAIDAYKKKTQGIIQTILITQTIELDSKAINERLQQLAYKSGRTMTAKLAKYQLKEMQAYFSVLSLGIILTAFTIYQTSGDFAYTALALSLSLLLVVFSIQWDSSLGKKRKEVSTLTQKIESDIASNLASCEEELIAQSILEKQVYPIDTPKPSSENPVKEKERAEKPIIDYARWVFGFNGLQPTQAFTSKSHKAQSSQHSSFFFKATLPAKEEALPVKKEELPEHYQRDSFGQLIFFNPQMVEVIGTTESRLTPETFSQVTYNVHKMPPSDRLKQRGINAPIAFKLKPQQRSNVRAYAIAEIQTVNGKSEAVCVVTHLLSKAHR